MADRTPEQVAADDALTAAIDAAVDAYGYRKHGAWINVHYMVLVEQRGWPDGQEDAESTGTVTLYKDGRLAWSSILGMLRMATLRVERDFNSPDDD